MSFATPDHVWVVPLYAATTSSPASVLTTPPSTPEKKAGKCKRRHSYGSSYAPSSPGSELSFVEATQFELENIHRKSVKYDNAADRFFRELQQARQAAERDE
ncbi:hypothetical protein Q5752_005995 [Cryptotrichosporon argae]